MKWQQIKIPNEDINIFCNSYIVNKDAMNIIVTHTPIVSTIEMQRAYEPLVAFGANVFAFDFSGTGKSEGNEKDFSRDSVLKDIDAVVEYIRVNYSSNIHLFGNTGIGGMFAQYYASSSINIKSFAQFSCIDYKNTAGLGYPYVAVKAMCSLLNLLPNLHFNMKPPKYHGYNEYQDNDFYQQLESRYPHIWKTSSKILQAMLECFVAPNSAIKNGVKIPTLVFKTMHDRYFKPEYFDQYYDSLTCKKKLVQIDNTHNSYYFDSSKFCEEAYQWFKDNQ